MFVATPPNWSCRSMVPAIGGELAALVPPPRLHLIRYHGVLAPHAADREHIVPAAAEPCAWSQPSLTPTPSEPTSPASACRRTRRLSSPHDRRPNASWTSLREICHSPHCLLPALPRPATAPLWPIPELIELKTPSPSRPELPADPPSTPHPTHPPASAPNADPVLHTPTVQHLSHLGPAALKYLYSASQRVSTLLEGNQTSGRYSVRWDGRDDYGNEVASGVYLYRLQAGTQVETRKVLLLR